MSEKAASGKGAEWGGLPGEGPGLASRSNWSSPAGPLPRFPFYSALSTPSCCSDRPIVTGESWGAQEGKGGWRLCGGIAGSAGPTLRTDLPSFISVAEHRSV